ncbi:MAG: Uncharacterized protein G01um101429_266 [Parcubacteria group bacterium Gr01-1014_29]|nr:MAG: Uncharacterized protein G01um101429_266 [Parcubacteria group bacterium Gr01-1014_29]
MFPVAEVLFQHNKGWIPAFLLIDSGATISALPKSDASVLGVVAEQGTHMAVKGIGGAPISGWRHDIRVKLGKNMLKIPLVFLDDSQAPRVLGRAGVFEKFLVVFEESKRRTGLLGKQTKEAQIVSGVLNKI